MRKVSLDTSITWWNNSRKGMENGKIHEKGKYICSKGDVE